MNSTRKETIRSILLLAGAFTFAFLAAESIHELGHYLVHRLLGSPSACIQLDPFGASRISGVGVMSPGRLLATTIAGPLFSLLSGTVILLILWKRRRPILLPLLLWGPIAMIQEAVNLSLGLLNPGSDADIIARAGCPATLLILLGVVLLLAGLTLISLLLPLAGLQVNDPFGRKLLLIAGGICSLMALRFVVTALINPSGIIENLVPLLFSLLLAVLLAAVIRPLIRLAGNRYAESGQTITTAATVTNLAAGVGLLLFQLLAF